MNLEHNYYSYKSVFPSQLCDDIITFCNQQLDQVALTGSFSQKDLNNKKLKQLKKHRNSNVVWINEPWITKHIKPLIAHANSTSGWNFDIDFAESYQFTKYAKTQHYDWHSDSTPKPYGDDCAPELRGKIRKISMSVPLIDGTEYEGGDFQIDHRNTTTGKKNVETIENARIKGTVTFFPSHVWHRVTPVTSGTRYSLVVWFVGKPFR
jgi:PKHD-type hydroxylase